MTATAARGSIVIAAHNEETVIDRCLSALEDGVTPGVLEVVVVCNGCTDRTAQVARQHGVEVLELTVASKPSALNAGDAHSRSFPRLYLDADVTLPGHAALAVLDRLAGDDGETLAARPPLRYDAAEASPWVRAYYRARSRTPSLTRSLWGAGAFALSRRGRTRFEDWPDVVADDLFAHRLFSPEEMEIVACAPVVVHTPRDVASLLTVLRRTLRGKTSDNDHAAARSVTTSARGLLELAVRHPPQIGDVAAYLALAVLARASLHIHSPVRWERDDSSR